VFDAILTVDNNDLPRNTADAIGTAAAPCVSPLTKEQLQQAFVYLLQVV